MRNRGSCLYGRLTGISSLKARPMQATPAFCAFTTSWGLALGCKHPVAAARIFCALATRCPKRSPGMFCSVGSQARKTLAHWWTCTICTAVGQSDRSVYTMNAKFNKHGIDHLHANNVLHKASLGHHVVFAFDRPALVFFGQWAQARGQCIGDES